MSRFFETLKEVSRSQLVPKASALDEKAGESETSDLNGLRVPLIPELPPPVQAMPELPHTDIDAAAPPPDEALGKFIRVNLDKKVPLIPHTLDKSIVEQYRRLRTKIQQQQLTEPIRTLLIASPGPGEGKTVTTINLGLSFAMLPSTRVLVIDGDLRKGTVGRWLGVADAPGFSNVIDGSERLEDAVFKAEDLPLYFMFSGTSQKPAAELLNSPALPETMRRLTERFDLILVDSSPVNLIADAQMLASSCDGVLLVARAFKTTSKAFKKMLQDLLPFRIVGTVLNGGMRVQLYNRYYGY